MKISLIIPAYQRPESLERVIASIEKQTRQPDQFIVVVRDTDFSNHQVLQKSPHIQKIVVSKAGLTPALNAGLKVATGEIVLFTDDDTEPLANWIEKIEILYLKNSNVGAVGGRDVIAKTHPVPGPIGRINFWGKPYGLHHLGMGKLQRVQTLKGANMSYRRNLISGFLENLKGDHAFNEVYVAQQVLKQNYQILYDPEIQVVHHVALRNEHSRSQLQNMPNMAFNMAYTYGLSYRPMFVLRFLFFCTLVGFSQVPGFMKATQIALKGQWSIYFWMLRCWHELIGGTYQAILKHSSNEK